MGNNTVMAMLFFYRQAPMLWVHPGTRSVYVLEIIYIGRILYQLRQYILVSYEVF